MKGADILVVHQAEDSGKWVVSDMFSAAYAKPATDPQQDASITSITASSTSLVAVIQRPLVTCDAADLPVLTNGLQQAVIWAFGNGTALSYHGPSSRGNALVAFVPDASAAVVADPPGVGQLDVFMPAYQVPQDATTTYTCTVVKVPAGPKKQLIRYQSTVSSKQVHHMIMYGCTSAPAAPEGSTFACAGMPADCQTFILGWVPGTREVVMPDDAGFPIGGTGVQWLALQVRCCPAPSLLMLLLGVKSLAKIWGMPPAALSVPAAEGRLLPLSCTPAANMSCIPGRHQRQRLQGLHASAPLLRVPRNMQMQRPPPLYAWDPSRLYAVCN
jgi:hypothetical protein